MNTTQKISSVNLNDFISGDKNKKQNFITSLGNAFTEKGFVALSGHFLEDAHKCVI